MARPLRVEFPGAVYHVTARGNERKPIFRDDEDRRRYLEAVEEMATQFGAEVLAFCLMPNHYHLLVRTPRANLSQAIGWLQTTYTIRFNRRHRRSGHLFQGRFKALLVEEDGYAISLMRYVHLNPVRIKAMNKATWREKLRVVDAYKWSSHRSHAGLARPVAWLRSDWLRYYGASAPAARAAYRKDICQALTNGDEMATPWGDVRGGLVLGGPGLWEKVKGLLKRKEGQQETRWNKSQERKDRTAEWQEKIGAEPDRRWKIWLRVRAMGERKVDVARDFGFRDGGSVLQIIKRLESKAKKDSDWARKLKTYQNELSKIES